jgi:hypothetical protein
MDSSVGRDAGSGLREVFGQAPVFLENSLIFGEAGAKRQFTQPCFAAARPIAPTIPCVARRAKHASAGSSVSGKNIRIYRSSVLPYKPEHPARHKGRFAIVTGRGPGCGGRDGVGARCGLQGGEIREQRQARYDTALTASSNGLDGERTPAVENTQRRRARTEKSCGPDARGLCVKSCGDAAANRRAHRSFARRRGQ